MNTPLSPTASSPEILLRAAHTSPPPVKPEVLLRLPQVVARVNLSKSSIYEMLNRTPPAFPRPLKLSRRAVCWPESAISIWISDRIAAGAQTPEH